MRQAKIAQNVTLVLIDAMKNMVQRSVMPTRKNANVEWNFDMLVQCSATLLGSAPYAPKALYDGVKVAPNVKKKPPKLSQSSSSIAVWIRYTKGGEHGRSKGVAIVPQPNAASQPKYWPRARMLGGCKHILAYKQLDDVLLTIWVQAHA